MPTPLPDWPSRPAEHDARHHGIDDCQPPPAGWMPHSWRCPCGMIWEKRKRRWGGRYIWRRARVR